MKIKGKKIEGPNVEIIPIPRGEKDDIILMARAILDMTPFEKMCPSPKPPMRKIQGGIDVPDLKDKNYQKQVEKYAEKRMAWMVITSLEATEGLEWEKVNASDSSTWLLMRSELKESGFSFIEIERIIAGVVSANALSEAKIEAARDRFLLLQQAQAVESSFQKEEENSTLSGEPVKDSK
jgi:hypothetical protein